MINIYSTAVLPHKKLKTNKKIKKGCKQIHSFALYTRIKMASVSIRGNKGDIQSYMFQPQTQMSLRWICCAPKPYIFEHQSAPDSDEESVEHQYQQQEDVSER